MPRTLYGFEASFLQFGGFDLIDNPHSAWGIGVSSQMHDGLTTFAGLSVAKGKGCSVASGLDGASFAGNPVVLAGDAHGVCSVRKKCGETCQDITRAEHFGGEVYGIASELRCGGDGVRRGRGRWCR